MKGRWIGVREGRGRAVPWVDHPGEGVVPGFGLSAGFSPPLPRPLVGTKWVVRISTSNFSGADLSSPIRAGWGFALGRGTNIP